MDIDIVKRALRTLLHYKCIIIYDKIRFSNIYQLTTYGRDILLSTSSPSASATLHKSTSQNQNKVSSKGQNYESIIQDLIIFCSVDIHTPISSIILQLLVQFKPTIQLSTIVLIMQPYLTGLNLRKFLAYTQHNKLIQRIYEYPVDVLSQSGDRGTWIDLAGFPSSAGYSGGPSHHRYVSYCILYVYILYMCYVYYIICDMYIYILSYIFTIII